MPESYDVWCIQSDISRRYFTGFAAGAGVEGSGRRSSLPCMGGTRKDAYEFTTEQAALAALNTFPMMVMADVVKRKSRRPRKEK